MQNKNKQYRIEKGLLLFTQPKSPYFYGKIRVDGKYITKSFAPISDLEVAKEKLYEWKKSLSSSEIIHSNLQQKNLRDEYIEHKKVENDFQFLEVGRFDPTKKSIEERKISFVEIYNEYNQVEASNKHTDVLIAAIHTANGSVQSIIIFLTG